MNIESNNIIKNDLDRDFNNLLTGLKKGSAFNEEFTKTMREYTNSLDIHFEYNLEDSLKLSIELLDIEKSDYILFPAVGPKQLPEVFKEHNLIFVPVHPRTLTIDVLALQKILNSLDLALAKPTIIAIETAGLPADYLTLEKIKNKYDANLISIANTGPGSSINMQVSSNFADIALINFNAKTSISIPDNQVAMIFNNNEYSDDLTSKLNSFNAIILKHTLRLYQNTESRKVAEIINFLNMNIHSNIEKMLIPAAFELNGSNFFFFTNNKESAEELKDILASETDKTFTEGIEFLANNILKEYYPGYNNQLNENKLKLERIVSMQIDSYAKIVEIKNLTEIINKFNNS